MMQLTAKLALVLPAETGVGRNGEWKKQQLVLETDGQYPKKICIIVWGDKINIAQLKIGEQLTVDFDVESREFNGRWYTDIKAWKIERAGQAPIVPPLPDYGAPAGYDTPPPPVDYTASMTGGAADYGAYSPAEPSSSDDLPF
ncbi:MAG: DUF3127 domain-containing protein [Bacteroidales bacterium]|jgi:hypothetical protein|nr:DUF3127 domain-containing protein [Bacteroidales bacterium]